MGRTGTVADGPPVSRRPDAVVVVTEVLLSGNDGELEASMTDWFTFDAVLAVLTDQVAVARHHLIGTCVLCTAATRHASLYYYSI